MSTLADPVRIGLIGTGEIAHLSHIPALSAIPELQLVAVADVNVDRAQQLGQQFGCRVYSDYRQLLDDEAVQAVIIATPNHLHGEMCISAAERGHAIFCEKPLAHNLVSAQEIVQACKDAGVILQVGFNQRFWSAVQMAKDMIDSGVIGTPHTFRSVYSEAWNVYPGTSTYRYHLEQSGGASINDLTVHRIDQARFLMGDIAEVTAAIEHSELPAPVDDNVMILCRFTSGALGCLSSDRFSPQVSSASDVF